MNSDAETLVLGPELDFHPFQAERALVTPDYEKLEEAWLDGVDEIEATSDNPVAARFLFRTDLIQRFVESGEFSLPDCLSGQDISGTWETQEILFDALDGFHNGGRTIIDTSTISLDHEGDESDQSPLTFDDLARLPAKNFYLHLGKIRELSSPLSGAPIIGAYIRSYRHGAEEPMWSVTVVTEITDIDRLRSTPLISRLLELTGQYSLFADPDAGNDWISAATNIVKEDAHSGGTDSELWRPHLNPVLWAINTALRRLLDHGLDLRPKILPAGAPVELLRPAVLIPCGEPDGILVELSERGFARVFSIASQKPGETDLYSVMPSLSKPIIRQNYHPFRYMSSRPFAKHISLYANTHPKMGGGLTESDLKELAEYVMRGYNASISSLPFEQRPSNTDMVMKEVSTAAHYARFVGAGRNIFSIDPGLAGLFEATDIDDIPADALQLPFQCLYIHLPPRADLALSNAAFVDGAYISVIGSGDQRRIEFMLTTVRPDWTGSKADWILRQDHTFYLSFPLAENRSLGGLIDQAIDSEIEILKDNGMTGDDMAEAQKEARAAGIALRNVSREGARRRVERFIEQHDVFPQVARVLVNALFYITAYQGKAESVWPEHTPLKLAEKADHGNTPKQKRDAEKELLRDGFSRIRLFKAPASLREALTADTGRTMPAHFRRGHWRRQPHGPRNSPTYELIWIQPVLVNATEQAGIRGHIYEVKRGDRAKPGD